MNYQEALVLLLARVNALFQPNDLRKQKLMWEELRKVRDEIEQMMKEQKMKPL